MQSEILAAGSPARPTARTNRAPILPPPLHQRAVDLGQPERGAAAAVAPGADPAARCGLTQERGRRLTPRRPGAPRPSRWRCSGWCRSSARFGQVLSVLEGIGEAASSGGGGSRPSCTFARAPVAPPQPGRAYAER
jgi:hypothetical protein